MFVLRLLDNASHTIRKVTGLGTSSLILVGVVGGDIESLVLPRKELKASPPNYSPRGKAKTLVGKPGRLRKVHHRYNVDRLD